MGVSIKSEGRAVPAQHHTISGGEPLFQAVVSERMRCEEEGSVRSAEI